MASAKRIARLRLGCLIALILFSAYVAIAAYPFGAWRFAAAFGVLAIVFIFLRVGWFAPFAIVGAYAGMILDAEGKGGTIESQMQETVTSIVAGTLGGLEIGAWIDTSRRRYRQAGSGDGAVSADEQTDERKPE